MPLPLVTAPHTRGAPLRHPPPRIGTPNPCLPCASHAHLPLMPSIAAWTPLGDLPPRMETDTRIHVRASTRIASGDRDAPNPRRHNASAYRESRRRPCLHETVFTERAWPSSRIRRLHGPVPARHESGGRNRSPHAATRNRRPPSSPPLRSAPAMTGATWSVQVAGPGSAIRDHQPPCPPFALSGLSFSCFPSSPVLRRGPSAWVIRAPSPGHPSASGRTPPGPGPRITLS